MNRIRFDDNDILDVRSTANRPLSPRATFERSIFVRMGFDPAELSIVIANEDPETEQIVPNCMFAKRTK